MDNTQLLNDYHFMPSRLLAGIIIAFYSVTIILAWYYLWDVSVLTIPLSVWLTCALSVDALRLCRRHAWQAPADAIVRVSYSPNERLGYLYEKSGALIRARVDSVLTCLPGVIKIEWVLLSTQKRYYLFIAKDQLSQSAYHQFFLRMDALCKMPKC